MQFYETDTFWGRVKERALANGLTIKALSDRLGESYKSITNRITENRIPKKKGLIEAIAAELGCSVEYLMTGVDSNEMKYGPEIEHLIFEYKLLDEKKRGVLRAVLEALTVKQVQEHEAFKQQHPELFRT